MTARRKRKRRQSKEMADNIAKGVVFVACLCYTKYRTTVRLDSDFGAETSDLRPTRNNPITDPPAMD